MFKSIKSTQFMIPFKLKEIHIIDAQKINHNKTCLFIKTVSITLKIAFRLFSCAKKGFCIFSGMNKGFQIQIRTRKCLIFMNCAAWKCSFIRIIFQSLFFCSLFDGSKRRCACTREQDSLYFVRLALLKRLCKRSLWRLCFKMVYTVHTKYKLQMPNKTTLCT